MNMLAAEGRIAPHSEKAEQGVLGSILIDHVRVLDFAISSGITPETFYFRAHAIIFEACLELASKGRPIDLLTISDALTSSGELEQIGGPFALQAMVDITPTSVHAESYIEIVKEAWLRREIIARARLASDRAYDLERDAQGVLSEIEQDMFSLSAGGGKANYVSAAQLAAGQAELLEKLKNREALPQGLDTGLRDIDEMLKGMQDTDLLILAARPSQGKTSLALDIAHHVAVKENPVAIFSLEMDREAIGKRLLCSSASVPFHQLTGRSFYPTEVHNRLVNASEGIGSLPLYIDDTASLDIMDMRARARRMARKHGIKFIVVDYLQLMTCAGERENQNLKIAAICSGLKGMAKELRVPVLVLSQLSRLADQGDGRPRLSHLRDSGSIEQDADVVILMRRPCKYPGDPDSGDRRLVIADIAKHRNGATGLVRLDFEEAYTRFSNRAKVEEQ